MSGKIYVAKETFSSAYVPEVIHKGLTRVREGHILLEKHPECFELLGEDREVHFETATREPTIATQVRQEAPAAPVEDWTPAITMEDMKRAELEVIAVDAGVENPAALPNKAALIAAIKAAGR